MTEELRQAMAEALVNHLLKSGKTFWHYTEKISGSFLSRVAGWYCAPCAAKRNYTKADVAYVLGRVANYGIPTNCIGCHKSMKDIIGDFKE